jgi:ABC-type oligopeptide transport system substrate-binding subunit
MDMDLKDENGQPYYETPTHITGYNNDAYTAIIEKAFDAVTVKDKAEALHEAEAALLADMPVIPIVFNQDAYLARKDLSGIKETYYSTRNFAKTKLKDYKKYLPEE